MVHSFAHSHATLVLIEAVKGGGEPVSYTHLDVYKRQISSHLRKWRIYLTMYLKYWKILRKLQTDVTSVSYTHLDKVNVSDYESKIENISDVKFQNDAHFTEVNTEYKYRFNMDRVKFFWNFMQTTSPSYLLMGSSSACLDLCLLYTSRCV